MLVDGDQSLHAEARPQPHAAGAFEQLADLAAIAGLAGVAQRLHHAAFLAFRLGNAPVQHLEAGGVLPPVLGGAVFAQQGVQPQRVVRPLLQQPVERSQALDAMAKVGFAQRFLGQRRRDPLEQGEIEQQVSVRFWKIPQQAFAQPFGGDRVGDDLLHGDGLFLAGRGFDVAEDAQRHRPALGAFLQGGDFAQRQAAVEEAVDLRGGEAQFLRGEGHPFARVELGQVQPGVVAHGQRDVEIRRAGMQQVVDRVQRLAAHQPFHVVQHQQAGRVVRADGVDQQLRAPPGAVRDGAVAIVAPSVLHVHERQAAGAERQRQVRIDDAGGVAFVHRQPSGEAAAVAPAMEYVRQQRGLAEAARRPQHRKRPQRFDPRQQIRAPKVAAHHRRPLRFGLMQPRLGSLSRNIARGPRHRPTPHRCTIR